MSQLKYNPFTGRFNLIPSTSAFSTTSFSIIQTPAGTNPVADSTSDTLTFSSTGSSITITGNSTTDTVDFVVNPANVDHSLLSNLTVGNPHTQYVLLAGLAGGQTVNGGTAASENLILFSTAHGTKGNILVNDAEFIIRDDSDLTKKAAFSSSGITTGTTRTFTFPNNIGTLMTLEATTQTLSGALIVGGDFTVNGTTTTINTATLNVTDANITVNKGGNQASAHNISALTIEMSNATHVRFIYDSTLASRFKIGDSGSEKEIIDASSTQNVSNKAILNASSIGIGTATPAVALDMVSKTDAVSLPSGSLAQRPTGVNGMIRYNNTSAVFEGYANGSWNEIGGSTIDFSQQFLLMGA